MAQRYPQQTFAVYTHPQWPEELKSAYSEDRESHPLDDRDLRQPSPMGLVDSRRHSMIKVEDDFNTAQHMWSERPHAHMAQMRHYSQPTVPSISTGPHTSHRPQEPNYGPYAPAPSWPMALHSQSSTPTPSFGPVQDPIPLQYTQLSNFPYQPQDPLSAVSMSPQSSQGGWNSATSSDGAEQRDFPGSPRFRAMSPQTVLRSDGIRKKNARFEIPRERNLANIDALIMQSTDDQEKKELKQQKRLLRNRQAALDSRQRKKTHTEKLELEKKHFSNQKKEYEETIAQYDNNFNQEREQWRQQQQQYEAYIQQLTYDRDQAIRTKTIETADLRRQNNVLKDCVRDLERQQHARGFSADTSNQDTFNNDFSNFSNLDLEDNFDDEFSFINSDDLKMEGEDSPARQLTPRPPPLNPETKSATKTGAGFSWNTFYMCLLFGAFIASNSKVDSSTTSAPSNQVSSQLPSLSEDYRNEAGNVLKAVLASDAESAHELIPSRSAGTTLPTTISGTEFSRMSTHASASLESLSSRLTTPSRQQEVAAVFSLTPNQYNEIANPTYLDDEPVEVKPTRLQQMFATLQAERDNLDRMAGISGQARERSVLLDRVPEKVLKDFREMVGLNEQHQNRE